MGITFCPLDLFSPQNQVSSMYLPRGYLSCGEAHDTVVRLTLDLLHMVRHSPTSQLQTLLLYGPRGLDPLPLSILFLSFSTFQQRATQKMCYYAHSTFLLYFLAQMTSLGFLNVFCSVFLTLWHKLSYS